MELIVAVYDDWGIGRDGTQPIALSADRKFFREETRGALVIAGRRTIADFPGGKRHGLGAVGTDAPIVINSNDQFHSAPQMAMGISKSKGWNW